MDAMPVSRPPTASTTQQVPPPAPVPQYALEAPPFEGSLQHDAFARPPQVGDDAIELFAHLVRDLVPLKAAAAPAPVPANPLLSSPLG